MPTRAARGRSCGNYGDCWTALFSEAVGGIANAVFENILALERDLIRLGISFPAGGLLVVVAMKQ